MSEGSAWQLTPEESSLVERHLNFYLSLATGKHFPLTAAQRHFVAVCAGRAKAETAHEIAYIKHRMQAAKERAESQTSNIDEYGEGIPRPGWFSDEGWRRMRGQYRSNSE